MPIDPRLADAPQLSAIPVPQRQSSPLAGAVADAANSVANTIQQSRAVDQQVAELQRRAAQKAQDEADNALLAKQGAALVNTQLSIRQRVDAARDGADRYGIGWGDTVKGIVDDEMAKWQAGFGTNDRVHQRFLSSAASAAADVTLDEDRWARSQRAKAQGQDGDAMVKGLGNIVFSSPDKWATSDGQYSDWVNSLSAPDTVKRQLLDAGRGTIANNAIEGLFAAGRYQDVQALLNATGKPDSPQGKLSAFLNERLSADDKARYLKRIEIEQHSADAARAAQAKAAKDAVEKEFDVLQLRVDGGGVPTPQERRDLYARMVAVGADPVKIQKLRNLDDAVSINQRFGPAADPDGSLTRARMAQLQDKARSGTPLTDLESREFKQLSDGLGTRHDAMAEQMKALAKQGVAGQMQVLGQLRRLPPAEADDVAEKTMPGLSYFGSISRGYQQLALEGHADLAANAKLLPPKTARGTRVDALFRSHAGSTLSLMPEEAVQGVKAAADALYVRMARGDARDTLDPDLYARAVNLAFGASHASGEWRGGLGSVANRTVLLPDWNTAAEFELFLRKRADFSGAVYGDGSPVRSEDVLKNLTPVYDGQASQLSRDGSWVYRFVDASGKPLLAKGGGVFYLPVKKR